MKTFKSFFALFLTFFVLASSAFAQSGTRMTNKKKDTLIGAGAGAVGGALIGKSVTGAIIGGAAGAVGGHIIGKRADKKRAAKAQQPVVSTKNY